jgi:indole-3-glycerol phosphate synthase
LRDRDFNREAQLEAYAAAGVAAVSVLTEPEEFHGSLAHLAEAAETLAAHGRPVMRKDFLTDPYQVLEARAAGAGGVLVIVTMLSDDAVSALVAAAREHGLFVLLETFDEDDLARIPSLGRHTADHGLRANTSYSAGDSAAGPRTDTRPNDGRGAGLSTHAAQDPPVLVGVNCRDLKTLRVDFDRFAALAPHLPPGYGAVAESGIASAADVQAVARLGYSLALVGSTLMQSADPARAAAELIDAGRAGRADGGRIERGDAERTERVDARRTELIDGEPAERTDIGSPRQ